MHLLKKNIYSILLFVFAFLIYANTIPNDYCLDDEFVTHGNPQVSHGISAIPDILTSFYQEKQGFTYGYRPVVKMTYAVEYSLFGWDPQVSHGVNALLYALLVVLVFMVTKSIFRHANIVLPLLTTLIFIVHPSHTEVVASLKNRDELLAVLFGFVSIWFFIRTVGGKQALNIVLGGLFLLLGLLSKMSILPLVVLIPMILYCLRPVATRIMESRKPKKHVKEYFSAGFLKQKILSLPYYFWVMMVLLAVAGFFGLASRLLPASAEGDTQQYNLLYWQNPLYFNRNYFDWILTCGATLWFYLKLMLFPFSLAFYYGYNTIPVSASDPLIWISLIIHMAAFVLAVRALIKSRNIAAFGFLFYILSLSMFANLFAPVAGIVAERLSFLASWGFAIMVAYIIIKVVGINLKMKTSRTQLLLLIVISLMIIVPFSIQTIKRNKEWKDHLTLFSADIEKLKQSAKANDLMAAALYREAANRSKSGQPNSLVVDYYRKAEKYYRRCADVYPQHYLTWNNMGLINVNFLNNVPKAVADFEQSVHYNPDFAGGWNNLGYAQYISGHYAESIVAYQKAVVLNPDSLSSWSSLSNVYFRKGDTSQARKINEDLMIHHPASPVPYLNLATYALVKKDTMDALKHFEAALKKDPQNENANSFLSYYRKLHGDVSETPSFLINKPNH